jgi:hypothetical protein
MPRLSLYRPEKGNDFKFLDRAIEQQFQMGGTDIYIHKYIGPLSPDEVGGEATPSTPNTSGNARPELGIQDVLLMENRDRKYDKDVYVVRGIYTMQDLDFNLSQFGLLLNNDTIMINFHLRNSVEVLSRKVMAGDVIELPHLKDEYALDDNFVALKRYYVVQDVTRPAAGFSPTWYPHLLRAKCTPLVDSQEYSDILSNDSGNGDGGTLKDLMSTYNQSIEINNQIIAQAEADAPKSGYDTTGLYVLPIKDNGLLDVADASSEIKDTSIENSAYDASIVLNSPQGDIYVGYLTGDGVPPNGAPFNQGITFPALPIEGQFYLRTDYLPNRLFRYNGAHWKLFESNVRMTMNKFGHTDVSTGTFANSSVNLTQKGTFINNNTTSTIAGKVVQQRQALSKALKPKADN